MQDLLFGAAPTDVSIFLVVSSMVLFVAALACLVPAIRASGIDPATALRAD